MISKGIEFWGTLVGAVSGGMLLMCSVLKGVFVTKSDCRRDKTMCLNGLTLKLQEMNSKIDLNHIALAESIDEINETMNCTGKWITALAQKQGIKQTDLPDI